MYGVANLDQVSENMGDLQSRSCLPHMPGNLARGEAVASPFGS
jgi:hypothetical protein